MLMNAWLYRPVLAIAVCVPLILGTNRLDWRLMNRASTYPAEPIMAVEWYTPRQTVPGQPGEPLPTLPAAESAIDLAALESISAYAEARNSTGLIVMHQGRIVWEAYWRGYGPEATFNAMSMTKTLMGMLIGIAIAEGHIASMEDPVATYVPEWRADARANIAIADLLAMQSGLRNEDQTDTLDSDLVQMFLGSDVTRIALSIPSLHPPGERFDYNNVNTQILGLVLANATGMPVADYLSTRLWQPLGAGDGELWLDHPGGFPKTFCCFFATARDWARVGQLWLTDGKVGDREIVPSPWLAQMATPSPLEPTFGYHLWIKARTADFPNVNTAATAPFLAEDTIYLDGRGVQRVYIIPSEDLVIVRMGEQPPNWDDAVIPNTLVQALRSP